MWILLWVLQGSIRQIRCKTHGNIHVPVGIAVAIGPKSLNCGGYCNGCAHVFVQNPVQYPRAFDKIQDDIHLLFGGNCMDIAKSHRNIHDFSLLCCFLLLL